MNTDNSLLVIADQTRDEAQALIAQLKQLLPFRHHAHIDLTISTSIKASSLWIAAQALESVISQQEPAPEPQPELQSAKAPVQYFLAAVPDPIKETVFNSK